MFLIAYYTKIKDQNCDYVIIVNLFIKTRYYKSGIRKHRVQLKKGTEKKLNEMPHVQNRLNFILLHKKRYVKKKLMYPPKCIYTPYLWKSDHE